MSLFFYYFSEISLIRTEPCLHGIVDRSTGSLPAVGSKLGWRTCEIAKMCAPSRLQPTALRGLCYRISALIHSSLFHSSLFKYLVVSIDKRTYYILSLKAISPAVLKKTIV